MAAFYDAVHQAKMEAQGGEMPGIEASKKILTHFNQGRLDGVSAAGYFIYDGVKVFEEGRRDEAESRDARTTEDAVFGKKK